MRASAQAPISARAPSPAITTASSNIETDIGAGAFIGSNTALVAPVKVGDGAYVGAGSTVAKDDVPEGRARRCARAERKDVAGWAQTFRARKSAAKAAKKKDGK